MTTKYILRIAQAFTLLLFLTAKTSVAKNFSFSIVGDSASAGFLANTSMLDEIKRRQFKPIKRDLVVYNVVKWWNPDEPHHQLDKYNFPDKAWPAFLAELLADDDHHVDVENFAVSSAVTKELDQQIKAREKTKFPDKAKKFVFVWIGHNDLISNDEEKDVLADRYRKEMAAALAQLTKDKTDLTVVILPVVDISEVYATLEDFIWERRKGLLKLSRNLTCRDTWKKLPYWRFFPRRGSAAGFEAVVGPKIKAMNEAVRNLVQDLTPAKPERSDNRFIFLAKLFKNQKMQPEDFAKDCFHPSEEGQWKIAELVYDAIKDLI